VPESVLVTVSLLFSVVVYRPVKSLLIVVMVSPPLCVLTAVSVSVPLVSASLTLLKRYFFFASNTANPKPS
jgi:hypothetical protein